MILVRDMKLSDTETASDIEKQIFSLPWSKQAFEDSVKREDTIFLVAENEGTVIGYIGMYMCCGEGEITNVAVSEDARRKGVGELLVTNMIDRANAHDVTSIFLEVRVSNENAIHLYEKTGFEKCGLRKGFYDFPKEDAYIMVKNL